VKIARSPPDQKNYKSRYCSKQSRCNQQRDCREINKLARQNKARNTARTIRTRNLSQQHPLYTSLRMCWSGFVARQTRTIVVQTTAMEVKPTGRFELSATPCFTSVSGGRATLSLKHWTGVIDTRGVSGGRVKLSLTHCIEAKDTGGVSGGWDMHSLNLVSCWPQSLKRSNIYMLYAICYMLYVICYMLYIYIYIYSDTKPQQASSCVG
jgi:hypothetical protein